MSKRMRIEAFCDDPLNMHPDTEEPADEERVINIDGSGNRLADCCDPCAKTVDALRAVLMERCVKVPVAVKKRRSPAVPTPTKVRAKRGGDRTDCQEPGCGKVFSVRSSLGKHVREDHGKSLRAYDWTN